MHTYTFPDTGITVKIRKVSPLLLNEIQRKNQPPKPPMNEVKYGDETRLEPNPADPEYQKAVQQHELDLELKLRRALLRLGVFYELTAEDTRSVAELRQYWQEEYKEELPGTDLEVFISYIAIGSVEDLDELVQSITRRSRPTEEAIAEAQDRFPSEVSGEASSPDSSPA